MEFKLEEATLILKRTPLVLRALLEDLPGKWAMQNEGENSWSVYDVLGHLIEGEKNDWMVRTRVILKSGRTRPFDPFDRFAQFETSKGKSLTRLLEEFTEYRNRNLEALRELSLKPEDFQRTGQHPDLGPVSLQELLSTWVVHDLNHLSQISRVLAKQWEDKVGPWKAYLGILKS